MPCYRCGARQTDPVRGASPWKRGVRANRQVLVCPDCQRCTDWTADLDRCPACASTALVRQLGETRCRDCGWVAADAADQPARPGPRVPGPAVGDTGGGLTDEVSAALDRLFGRGPG